MQRVVDSIFAYYDLLLPISSDEITKKHQMLLINPQCGHKEVEKNPSFLVILPSRQVLPYIISSYIYSDKNKNIVLYPAPPSISDDSSAGVCW